MTKKVDTDPNFPPPKDADPSSDAWLDAALDEFAKPQALDHKEKRSTSAGVDAAEYHAEPHVPPQRVEHNTFPNAPVIVNQTDPGVAPPPGEPGALGVTPAERKRLEKMFEEKRKAREHDAAKDPAVVAVERQADTGPRHNDPHPPGVVTDPPKHSGSGAKIGGAIVALAILALVVLVATHKTGSSATDGAPSASATTSVTPPTTTSAMAPVAPTVTTATIPTATETVEPPAPTTTATAHATSTHVHASVPTATVTATATAPTVTATVTATTSANPEDPEFSSHMRIEKK